MLVKLVSRLLLPPGGLLLLFAAALVLAFLGRRRLALVVAGVAGAAFWILSTPIVADRLVQGLEGEVGARTIADLPVADAIVVLGGGIGPALPPRTVADLSEGADRVLFAARLARAGKAPLVVASGGYPAWVGAPTSESAETKALLVEWGVPADHVLLEERSLDTLENAADTAKLLRERGLTKILLVTSALHMPRALEAFRATGLDVTAAPTDYAGVENAHHTVLDYVPTATAFELSVRSLHEHLGRLWYRLHGLPRAPADAPSGP